MMLLNIFFSVLGVAGGAGAGLGGVGTGLGGAGLGGVAGLGGLQYSAAAKAAKYGICFVQVL